MKDSPRYNIWMASAMSEVAEHGLEGRRLFVTPCAHKVNTEVCAGHPTDFATMHAFVLAWYRVFHN